MAQEQPRESMVNSTAGAEAAEVRVRAVPGEAVADAAPQHPLGPPPTTLTPPATQRPGGTTRVTPASLRENMLVLGAEGETVGTVDGLAPEETVRLKADALGQHHWIPFSWIARVDDQAHLDRPTNQARQEWLDSEPGDEAAGRS